MNDADAIKVLRSFKKNANLLNNYYRKQDISNLKALRITRLLSWLETEGLPNTEGKKRLFFNHHLNLNWMRWRLYIKIKSMKKHFI